MPNMADIVVKKADETTNVTLNALVGSSGETVPAKWRMNSSVEPVAFKPTLQTKTKPPKNGKQVTESLVVFPITRTDGGVTSQEDASTFRMIGNVSYKLTQAQIDEQVHVAMNLFASALHKSALKEGVSPRG